MRTLMVGFLSGFMLSMSLSALCWWQAGASLGVFLGPLVLVTLIVPPLILAQRDMLAQLSVLTGIMCGPTILWVSIAKALAVNGHELVLCCAVLSGWIIAQGGGALILRELRFVPALASTMTTLVSLTWLTWPIWLSPALASHERTVLWLSWAHPVTSINGVVRHLGVWGSPMGGSDFAYRYLTILNQDVAIPRTQSVWPSVALGWSIGVPLLTLTFMITRVRYSREGQKEKVS